MEFGYFTLSDNHYLDNPRTPNQFVADITAEALHAERLGMHSARIGEHHFSSLGVLSCPDPVLLGSPAQITDTSSKVEAAGLAEVILYFNVGLKPRQQVKEEMDRFMREVAPPFAGAHKNRAA